MPALSRSRTGCVPHLEQVACLQTQQTQRNTQTHTLGGDGGGYPQAASPPAQERSLLARLHRRDCRRCVSPPPRLLPNPHNPVFPLPFYEQGCPVPLSCTAPHGKPLLLRERKSFIENLLVRIHSSIEMIWWTASRHGSLNHLFLVALYIPS